MACMDEYTLRTELNLIDYYQIDKEKLFKVKIFLFKGKSKFKYKNKRNNTKRKYFN